MNIYVGNLSYDATESDLRETFEAFGTVSSASLIMDQRLFWVFTLTYLVFRGAGAISLDALLNRVGPWAQTRGEVQAA